MVTIGTARMFVEALDRTQAQSDAKHLREDTASRAAPPVSFLDALLHQLALPRPAFLVALRERLEQRRNQKALLKAARHFEALSPHLLADIGVEFYLVDPDQKSATELSAGFAAAESTISELGLAVADRRPSRRSRTRRTKAPVATPTPLLAAV